MATAEASGVEGKLLSVAPAPAGFTAGDLAARIRDRVAPTTYAPRHAAYDLLKLRGKGLVTRVGTTRRYRLSTPAIRTLSPC